MKKSMLTVLLIALCLSALSGCESYFERDVHINVGSDNDSRSNTESRTENSTKSNIKINSETKRILTYVQYVDSNGFIGDANEIEGAIYIKYANADEKIKVFNTVAITFSEGDLIKKSGYYTALTGNFASYEYVLNNPLDVHINDPTKGEPVFG